MGYREESISYFEKFYQPLLYYVWLLYEFNLRKIPNLKLDKFCRLYMKGEIYISHNIYMQSWNTTYVPSRLSPQWLCGNTWCTVGTWWTYMNCHKAIVVITGDRYGTSFLRKTYGRSSTQGTNDQIMPRRREGSQIRFPVIWRL